MNRKILFALWGFLFSLCAGLGFIPDPEGTARVLLTVLSLLCFLPPVWLLVLASKSGKVSDTKLIRNLSALSLGLTLVLLIVNFLSALASETLGMILHYILIIVTSPMICSGHWAMSMFLWACLLVASQKQLRQ